MENLYFVMEYVPGGDLMNLLIHKGIFSEEMARYVGNPPSNIIHFSV